MGLVLLSTAVLTLVVLVGVVVVLVRRRPPRPDGPEADYDDTAARPPAP